MVQVTFIGSQPVWLAEGEEPLEAEQRHFENQNLLSPRNSNHPEYAQSLPGSNQTPRSGELPKLDLLPSSKPQAFVNRLWKKMSPDLRQQLISKASPQKPVKVLLNSDNNPGKGWDRAAFAIVYSDGRVVAASQVIPLKNQADSVAKDLRDKGVKTAAHIKRNVVLHWKPHRGSYKETARQSGPSWILANNGIDYTDRMKPGGGPIVDDGKGTNFHALLHPGDGSWGCCIYPNDLALLMRKHGWNKNGFYSVIVS